MTSYEDIVLEVAEELGLPPNLVREVVRQQFKFTKDIIEEGKFRGVLLRYLGKFAVKPGRMELYVKKTQNLQRD